jgi:acid phosphatase
MKPKAILSALATLALIAVGRAQELSPPRPDHIVIVVEENHGFKRIIGSAAAPYINSLAQRGVLFTRSYAIRHPSQPNYLALFSGSLQGMKSDSCPHYFGSANLGSELIAAGFTFAGYSESLPANGFKGCRLHSYTRSHNPWVNFTNLADSTNLRFEDFPTNFDALPTVAFVIPDKRDDMHDGSIVRADTWLHEHLDSYVQWAQTNNSLFVLTWDEGGRSGPKVERNRIATLFVGPMVQSGTNAQPITHYNVLRTIEDMYGLPALGDSATNAPITNIWVSADAGAP